MNMVAVGIVATWAACLSLYLSSSNQTLAARPWPRVPSLIGGLIGFGLGLSAFVSVMKPLAGTFSFVVVMMVALVLLPYVGAWRNLGTPEDERRRRRA